MAFHIRNEQAESLLRELRELTGESLTETVRKALAERLERERARRRADAEDPEAVMEAVWARLKLVPDRETRTDEEILGYGPDGLPH